MRLLEQLCDAAIGRQLGRTRTSARVRRDGGGGEAGVSCHDSKRLQQRLGETELVTVRVRQVEEPLAPFGIAWRGVRPITGRDHARMKGVDVRNG